MLSQEAGQAATEGRDLGAWARVILVLSGTPPGLRGLGRWVCWPHRLKEGKEMPLRLRLIEFGACCFVREYFDVAYLAVCVWCLVCPPVDLSENEMEDAREAGELLVCVGYSEVAGVEKWIAGSTRG